MIGRISGTLLQKQAPELLLETHGVGYEIQCPMSSFFQLPAVGEAVILHIHMVVREDAQLLFGFTEIRERTLFRQLIKVNGVGPKMALAILSGMSATDFARCVRDGDSGALVKLPGVGKKTAERLLIEMRDRVKDWPIDDSEGQSLAASEAPIRDSVMEAESALLALGYKPQEASKAVAAVKAQANNSEELIRLALKGMVGR